MELELYRRGRGAVWLDDAGGAMETVSETGRLLTIAHSRGGRALGPRSLFRFTRLAFDANGRRLAASDQRGDVHVFDFDLNE